MNAITVEQLTKRYGAATAVDGISFEVPAGQLVAVLGPNGAGKTTTIEALEGFVEPSSGSVRVLGAEPSRAGRDWRARVGLVLQSTSLDGDATVQELLALFAGLYAAPRPVAEVLDLVDLTAEKSLRVGALSGGQQRRVDLGLAVIGRPEILFLDEPTVGLDPEARRRCWATIEDITAAGATVLLTTHYLDEADHLADRLIILAGGRIAADTTPAELRARSGPATITYPLPDHAPVDNLPAGLAGHVRPVDRVLHIRTPDVTGCLRQLLAWADRHRLTLSGVQVGPPSLEDAYLALVDQPMTPEPDLHAFSDHVA